MWCEVPSKGTRMKQPAAIARGRLHMMTYRIGIGGGRFGPGVLGPGGGGGGGGGAGGSVGVSNGSPVGSDGFSRVSSASKRSLKDMDDTFL
jgi:hypothetical protein